MRGLVRWAVLAMALAASSGAAGADLRPQVQIRFGASLAHPGQAVPVIVTVADAAGAPLDVRVTIDVDAGSVSAPESFEPGGFRATIFVPRLLPHSRTMLVLARAGGGSAQATLELGPGPAATLSVDGPSECSEDAEACYLDVRSEDGEGNPAAEVPSAAADLGRLSPAAPVGPGRWMLAYHPPRVDRERKEQVRVELGGLRAVHALRLVPPRTRFGFAPVVGVVSLEGRSGLAAGAEALARRRVGSGWTVGAGAEISWWSLSQSGQAAGLEVSTDRSQLAVGVRLQLERVLWGRTTLTLSAGGGALRVTSTDHVQGQPGVTETAWAPTASAAVGLGWAFAAGMPFLELRGAWVGDAHLATDPGVKWPAFLLVGYRLDVH